MMFYLIYGSMDLIDGSNIVCAQDIKKKIIFLDSGGSLVHREHLIFECIFYCTLCYCIHMYVYTMLYESHTLYLLL